MTPEDLLWRRICATTGMSLSRAKNETSCSELFQWAAYFEKEDDRETKLERGIARLCHLVDCVLAGFSGGTARGEEDFLVKYDRTPKPDKEKPAKEPDPNLSKKAWLVGVGLRSDGTPRQDAPKRRRRR